MQNSQIEMKIKPKRKLLIVFFAYLRGYPSSQPISQLGHQQDLQL